jgi:hypothetical protein
MIAYRLNTYRGFCQRTLACWSIPALLLTSACGSITSMDATAAGCPAAGCFADASVDSKGPVSDAGSPDVDSAVSQNPLCGTGCSPNNENACVGIVLDAGADAAAPPSDAGHGDAGAYDAALVKDAAAEVDVVDIDAGGGNMGGYFGPSTPSGADAAPAGPAVACQVTWAGDTTSAVCTASGLGQVKDPCSKSSDCAAGLTCVGTLAIAQCLRYCCGVNDDCGTGFYCSEEVARDSDPAAQHKVPVCVLGRGCDPLNPASDPNKCDTGLSCVIVKSDGTTGCIALPKDAAQEGESCKSVPCAEGFVCAKTTNTCMRLCHVGGSDECAGGVCKGGSTNLPVGFGICLVIYDD